MMAALPLVYGGVCVMPQSKNWECSAGGVANVEKTNKYFGHEKTGVTLEKSPVFSLVYHPLQTNEQEHV